MTNRCDDCNETWENVSYYPTTYCPHCSGSNISAVIEIKLETKVIPELNKWFDSVSRHIPKKSKAWGES
jgi:hypothetical protein